jgi:hypothetical protein
MGLLRGILDRIVLIAAILAAACVPSFIAQYRQRLGGRLDQAIRDLAPFQEIANRNHGGDLKALIEHHLASVDKTFREEGAAIQAMADAVERLRAAVTSLNTDLWHQLAYMMANADHDLVVATWGDFVPAFSFTPDYALFALGVGVAIWLVFLATWFGCARLISSPRRVPSRGTRGVR